MIKYTEIDLFYWKLHIHSDFVSTIMMMLSPFKIIARLIANSFWKIKLRNYEIRLQIRSYE